MEAKRILSLVRLEVNQNAGFRTCRAKNPRSATELSFGFLLDENGQTRGSKIT
jgi:hypothetical protein